MPDVNINAGVTESHRFEEQAGDVATPAAGYFKDYFKVGGYYWIDDAGVVAGPIGAGFEPGGRLTLTTATPVTTADVTAAATLYYTPYKHNMISVYDGARWIPKTFAELSLSLVGYTASKPYDIFAYLNSGVVALESLVWTNATTRATALAYQDGRLVKSGATTRLYLGTIYINSSGAQTDDSVAKRNVWNYYNRRYRSLWKTDATSHTYNSATPRAWNNDAAIRVEYMCGVLEDTMDIGIFADVLTGAGSNTIVAPAFDVTNSVTTLDRLWQRSNIAGNYIGGIMTSKLITTSLAIGWHWWQAVEVSSATGTNTFYEVMVMGGIWG